MQKILITKKDYIWLRHQESKMLKKVEKNPQLLKSKDFGRQLSNIQWHLSLYETQSFDPGITTTLQ